MKVKKAVSGGGPGGPRGVLIEAYISCLSEDSPRGCCTLVRINRVFVLFRPARVLAAAEVAGGRVRECARADLLHRGMHLYYRTECRPEGVPSNQKL